MGVQDDIGPSAMPLRQLQILCDKVFYEAQLARDCAEHGAAHDRDRAEACLRKVNALTAGLAARIRVVDGGGCLCATRLGPSGGTMSIHPDCPHHGHHLRVSASPREAMPEIRP